MSGGVEELPSEIEVSGKLALRTVRGLVRIANKADEDGQRVDAYLGWDLIIGAARRLEADLDKNVAALVQETKFGKYRIEGMRGVFGTRDAAIAAWWEYGTL